jgi:prepilin peptidase CpaA
MLTYLLFASLLGGALTLSLLAVRRWPLPLQLKQVLWIDRLHDSKTGVPYGIALAAAGLLVYPGSLIFQRLVG